MISHSTKDSLTYFNKVFLNNFKISKGIVKQVRLYLIMSLIKHTVIYIVYIFFTLKLIIAQVDNILILMFKYLGNKIEYL